MRTISKVLSSLLLASFIATGVVGTSVAGDDRYPIFVDCPRFAGGSHCDTLFAQVRAENPDHDHPNNGNIRYHLISGPGEIDERTGLWSYKWSPGDILFGDTIEIAASFGNSSQHVTPPDEYCRFWIQIFDEPSMIFVNGHGQRKNFVFFVAAPGVHYFDVTVEDPDQCDSPNVEIVNVSPAVEGLFYIEHDQLVFAADAVHDDKKFVVTLVDRGSPMMYSQSFIFDTRDNPVPWFETCPEDAIITQCDKARYHVRAIDRSYPNSIGITLEVASGPGVMMRNTWFYTPSEADVGQTYEIEIIARYGHIRTEGDQSCRFNITISDPTVGIEPMDFVCGDSITIPELIPSVFRLNAIDDDCTSLEIEIVNVTPTFTGDITISSGRRRPPFDSETHQIRISPDSADLGQTFHLTLEGTGSDGELYNCNLTFTAEPARPYRIRIDSLGDVEQGRHAHLDVILEEGNIPMGSFDFMVSYNPSALLFQGVIPGDFLNDCGWEYFNYTFVSYGPPVDGIPTAQFRVKAIATTRDVGMPSCFLPDDLPATLFTLDFLISNDRTLGCNWEPIRFYWPDCNDNIIRPNGYKGSALSRNVYDADSNLVTPEDSLPTFAGVPDDCLQDQKNYPRHRLIDFQHGGIHIVCADSIDPRVSFGDVNLNGRPFEIADAVLLANYFVYGESVFVIDAYRQSGASDANRDGHWLTIEDLQYMIQVIVGEADPYHQWDTTSSNPAFFRQETDGSVSVATPDTLGAAWLLFDGDVTPVIAAYGMGIGYSFDGSVTRVLIYSPEGNSFPAGPLLSNVSAPLLEVQTCTYNGAKVEAIIDQSLDVNDDDDAKRPDRFALMQNYPNPFNNSTVIRFDLPRASEVQLTVYNIIGQVVVQRTRHYQAGYHEFVWGGRSKSGDEMAGGVYFYQLQARSFTSTKKMLLLK